MSILKAVVLAGGSGSRLWPSSRAARPKQFLALNGEDTMLQATVKRLASLNIESVVTICNEEHRFLVAEQLREINEPGMIILEPVGRNTAPAIALASLLSNDDDLLLVLAADHVIQDDEVFTKAVSDAIPIAESGKLVTFGVTPDKANVGYGYIRRGAKYDKGFVVEEFVEKPSGDVAKEYVESGNYYWNSGIFLFHASRYLEELMKFCPDIYEACSSSLGSLTDNLDFIRIDSEKFQASPAESIDYAVMEKTADAIVIPMDAGWNDIGTWSSLWEISQKDEGGNVVNGDAVLHETSNCYIRSEKDLVATVGVDNLIIVATQDVCFIADKEKAQDAKVVVQALKDASRSEWNSHREVHRPWGKYESVDRGERYQVKRITVKPGGSLSVQMHYHRSEHWVVVSGTAKVMNGEKTFLLYENESTYIPKGVTHSLENAAKTPLEIIEIQSGSYLGEDDIVRFHDIYGRTTKQGV